MKCNRVRVDVLRDCWSVEGVAGGSIAAAWQGVIGYVAVGSLFAALQSAQAAGIGTSAAVVMGAGVGVVAASTVVVASSVKRSVCARQQCDNY